MAATSKNWTPQHEEAHAALVSLKVPPKEAKSLVEAQPNGESGEILRQALRARSGAQKRLPVIPGAPANAVPLHAPSQPSAPPQPVSDPEVEEVSRRLAMHRNPNRGPMAPFGPMERSPAEIQALAQAVQANSQGPPPAPMGPVQTQQTPPAMAQAQAGHLPSPVPPRPTAPLAAPHQPNLPSSGDSNPSGEIPSISTRAEYDKLPKGQVFRWHTGVLYTAHTKEPGSSATTEKPRIRVRATGTQLPPAPLSK